jgi:hypothetical protein
MVLFWSKQKKFVVFSRITHLLGMPSAGLLALHGYAVVCAALGISVFLTPAPQWVHAQSGNNSEFLAQSGVSEGPRTENRFTCAN